MTADAAFQYLDGSWCRRFHHRHHADDPHVAVARLVAGMEYESLCAITLSLFLTSSVTRCQNKK